MHAQAVGFGTCAWTTPLVIDAAARAFGLYAVVHGLSDIELVSRPTNRTRALPVTALAERKLHQQSDGRPPLDAEAPSSIE